MYLITNKREVFKFSHQTNTLTSSLHNYWCLSLLKHSGNEMEIPESFQYLCRISYMELNSCHIECKFTPHLK